MLSALKTHNTEPSPSANPQSRTLKIVFFTVLMDLIGFGIIIPIQPFYAETLGAHVALITLVGASFSLMQFLFAPLWGRLSDRYGRRPIMLVSILASSLGYLLFGLADTLLLLFLARILGGLGSANIGTAQAIIADSTTGQERAKGMGMIGAAFGLGFIIGPALGGILGQISMGAPGYFAAGLGAVNWILAFMWLPETRVASPQRSSLPSPAFGFSWANAKALAQRPHVRELLILFLTFTMAFALMEQSLGLFVEKMWVASHIEGHTRFRQASGLTALVLMTVGITATVVQGVLIGRLASRFGEPNLLAFGTCVVALALGLIPFIGMSAEFPLLIVNTVFMAIGSGMVNPSLPSLLSKSVSGDIQGEALGTGQSLSALGRILGPAIAGWLFSIAPGIPFWIASISCVACAWLAFSLRSKIRKAAA